MQTQVMRALVRLSRESWKGVLLALAIVFFVSWPFMWLFEREASDIADPSVYWYYFDVTGKTIGYGDKTPQTLGGRIVYKITSDITLPIYVVLLTMVGLGWAALTRRIERGLVQLFVANHTVVVGYHKGRTEKLVKHLLDGGAKNVVVCATPEQTETDPFIKMKNVRFVSGDLELPEIYRRACLGKASGVVIDGLDDRTSRGAFIAVRQVCKQIHVVAMLCDMTFEEKLDMIFTDDTDLECIPQGMVALGAKAVLQRGSGEVLTDLMSPESGQGEIFIYPLPAAADGITVGQADIYLRFARHCNFTAVQLHVDGRRERLYEVSPDYVLTEGMDIVYTARQALGDLDWDAVRRVPVPVLV